MKSKKITISISGGFGLLQIVLELDIEQCVSEDTGSLNRWIVRSYQLEKERNILNKGVKISS